MKVKAIRKGYYNHRRRYEGEAFKLFDDKHYSAAWMEKLEAKAEVPVEPIYAEHGEEVEETEDDVVI